MGRLRPSMRIATRLVVAFALPTALVVTVTGVFAVLSAREAFQEQYRRRLEVLATTLGAQIDADRVLSLLPGDEAQRWYLDLAAELERQRRAADLGGLVLLSGGGLVYIDADRRYVIEQRWPHWDSDQDVVARALTGDAGAWVEDTRATPAVYRAYRRLEVPGLEGASGASDEILLLAVESSLHYRATIRAYVRTLLPVGLLSLLAVGLIAVVVARGITRPVHRLVEEARRIGGGDLEAPVTSTGDDEIGFLGRTLDEMRGALQRRDRERQAMLASIAHEVRNPLGGMELFLGLLREGLDEPVADDETLAELRGYSDRVRREMDYLKGVVNDFLAFAREMPLSRREVELRPLLDEVRDVIEGDARSRGVRFELVCDDGLRAALDPGAIHRALLNLVQNALQATPADGRVRLCGEALDDGGVRIAVEDTGSGIPADKLPDVRTPFFTTKEKGTGLGLAIVDKIARAHGGRLQIRSEPGVGTTVALELPRGEVLEMIG
ncbi:MAG: ATP-binding protein [Pseudomonadota bacterium]